MDVFDYPFLDIFGQLARKCMVIFSRAIKLTGKVTCIAFLHAPSFILCDTCTKEGRKERSQAKRRRSLFPKAIPMPESWQISAAAACTKHTPKDRQTDRRIWLLQEVSERWRERELKQIHL